MAQMYIGSGRVQAEFQLERRPGLLRLPELRAQFVLGDDLDRAPLDLLHLLIDC